MWLEEWSGRNLYSGNDSSMNMKDIKERESERKRKRNRERRIREEREELTKG